MTALEVLTRLAEAAGRLDRRRQVALMCAAAEAFGVPVPLGPAASRALALSWDFALGAPAPSGLDVLVDELWEEAPPEGPDHVLAEQRLVSIWTAALLVSGPHTLDAVLLECLLVPALLAAHVGEVDLDVPASPEVLATETALLGALSALKEDVVVSRPALVSSLRAALLPVPAPAALPAQAPGSGPALPAQGSPSRPTSESRVL